jgi:hypothetical protein
LLPEIFTSTRLKRGSFSLVRDGVKVAENWRFEIPFSSQ